MEFDATPIAEMPKLAWGLRATCDKTSVIHGQGVETTDRFLVEGVWTGDYEEGRFDQLPMFGTGLKIDGDTLTLVASITPIDRVFTTRIGKELFASNSLPLFLAMTDDQLDNDWLFYRSLFISAKTGFRISRRTLPTQQGRQIRVLMGETATLESGGRIRPLLRPLDEPFHSFQQYRQVLADAVSAIIINGSSERRRNRFEPLVALSSGYDSTAVAVLFREAGGREAVTMLRYSEDGERIDYPGAIAERLGLNMKEVERDTWRERTDLPDAEIACAATEFIDIPFLALEEELSGKALFLGYPGDNLWGKSNYRHYNDIVQTDTCGQGLAEYRLRVGFVSCPVPYIGGTAHSSLYRITNARDMASWSVGGSYDRPIARRIAEEAGVGRQDFATRKYGGSARIYSNTKRHPLGNPAQMNSDMTRFMTREGAAAFVRYCLGGRADRHAKKMRRVTAASWIYHKLVALNHRVGRRLNSIGIKGLVPRRLMTVLASRFVVHTDYTYLLPHWGTNVVKSSYERAVDALRPGDSHSRG
ncbi:MAG: hypothetical protein JXA57_20160, partial [Armatimonadetes bacterium]|nr:hypothetical protein [Armatimonadota bacterium]